MTVLEIGDKVGIKIIVYTMHMDDDAYGGRLPGYLHPNITRHARHDTKATPK